MSDNGTLGSRNPFAIKATTPTRGEDPASRESRPLVAPPTLVLGGTGAAQDSPRTSGFVLKPSALSAQTSNLKIYNTPTRLNNNNGKLTEKSPSTADSTDDVSAQKDAAEETADSGSGEHSDKTSIGTKKDTEEKPSFECVALGSISADAATEAAAAAAAKGDVEPSQCKANDEVKSEVVFGENLDSRVATNVVLSNPVESSISVLTHGENDGFVFGQNIRERVTNADVSETQTELASSGELSFAMAACEKDNDGSDTCSTDGGSHGESKGRVGEKRTLTETAEEHQLRLENEAKKGRLHEVEVVTGEEDESNVLQINCKLYVYEGAQYQERGRGVLRVNDKQNPDDGSIQSRVVMRTQGSLRVVLNTSVWSGMKVEHPSAKSIRLTGQSPEGAIGVFVVQCTSPKDADQLFHALEWRVQALKRVQQQHHHHHHEEHSPGTPEQDVKGAKSSQDVQQASDADFDHEDDDDDEEEEEGEEGVQDDDPADDDDPDANATADRGGKGEKPATTAAASAAPATDAAAAARSKDEVKKSPTKADDNETDQQHPASEGDDNTNNDNDGGHRGAVVRGVADDDANNDGDGEGGRKSDPAHGDASGGTSSQLATDDKQTVAEADKNDDGDDRDPK